MSEHSELSETPGHAEEAEAEPGAAEADAPSEEAAVSDRDEGPQPDNDLISTLERLTEVVDRQTILREKDQLIAERLHEENEKLRIGEIREIQRPLVSDVAQLVYIVSKESSEDPQEVSRLDFVRDGLLEILASAGVFELPVGEGDAFERGLHKAVEKVTTTDETRSGRIAEVKRPGFGWTDGKVLRPAEVKVFMFESNAHSRPNQGEKAKETRPTETDSKSEDVK